MDEYIDKERTKEPMFSRIEKKVTKKETIQSYLKLLDRLHKMGLHIPDSDLRWMDERLVKVKQKVTSGSQAQLEEELNSLVWNYTSLIIEELEFIRRSWCKEKLKEYHVTI